MTSPLNVHATCSPGVSRHSWKANVQRKDTRPDGGLIHQAPNNSNDIRK